MNFTTQFCKNVNGSAVITDKVRLQVQDDFGRATKNDVRDAWDALSEGEQRETFLWLAFSCLAQDSAYTVLKVTKMTDVRERDLEAIEAAYQERLHEVYAQELELTRRSEELDRQAQALEDTQAQLARATARAEELLQRARQAEARADSLARIADKAESELHALKAAIQLIGGVLKG